MFIIALTNVQLKDIRKHISGRIIDNNRKRAAGKKVVDDIDCLSSDILNQVWFITKETVESSPEKKFIYRFSGLLGQSSCCEQTLWTDILAFNNKPAECQKTRLHHYIAGIIYLSYSFQQPLLSVHERFQLQHNDYIKSQYGNKSEASDVKYDDRKVFQFQLSDLILSPQQLSILRSGIRHLVVYGEAGSGKSSLLLALALEKCGKQVVSSAEHVYYFVPDRKSFFHEDLETFRQKYCEEGYFHVTYLSKFKDTVKKYRRKATFLVDEVYHTHLKEIEDYTPHESSTVWVACVIGGQKNVPDVRVIMGSFKTCYLTVLYRSSAHISGLSTYILNKWILPELGASSAVLFKCFSGGNKKSFQLKRVWPSNQDQQHVISEMVRSFYFSHSFVDQNFDSFKW